MNAIIAEHASAAGALPAINPDTDNTTTLSLSTSTARTSTALSITESNLYRIISTVNCFINKGGSAVNSTTSKMFLKSNVDYYFVLDKDEYISGITSSGTGTLFITPSTKVS